MLFLFIIITIKKSPEQVPYLNLFNVFGSAFSQRTVDVHFYLLWPLVSRRVSAAAESVDLTILNSQQVECTQFFALTVSVAGILIGWLGRKKRPLFVWGAVGESQK